MPDFTISHIGSTKLSHPMPVKHIKAKGETFMFQADDGSNLGSRNEGIPIIFEEDYWLCAYQTTQEFWSEVVKISGNKELKEFPSSFKGKTRPVESISWDDIQIFNSLLNNLITQNLVTIENKQNGNFGLSSETQWEYAANAKQNLVFGGSQNLFDVGWFIENSNNQTMPVGLKEPNAFGLYDMNGNVWEWCADDFSNDIKEIPINGLPNFKSQINSYNSLRGGGHFRNAEYCRLRNRNFNLSGNRNSSYGFRLGFFPSSKKMRDSNLPEGRRASS